MSSERIALVPESAECCDRRSRADEEGWQAQWLDDGLEEDLVCYPPPSCGGR